MILMCMTHEVLDGLLDAVELQPFEQVRQVLQIHLVKFVCFCGIIYEELGKLQFLLLLQLL